MESLLIYKLKEIEKIRELYNKFNADGLKIEEIGLDEYLNEYSTTEERYYISSSETEKLK